MTRLHYMLRLLLIVAVTPALRAEATIYGTMSNFDVFNETEHEAHGAEIELEGVHVEDLGYTFPSHFDSKSVAEYMSGTVFGTRITYSGYNFSPTGFLAPSVGQSTNGHTCVNTPGCEHFGFSTIANQPTAARYYWLDQSGQRIGTPMSVPAPTWTYIPPANPGGAPALRAEVEPVEVEAQQPDSLWMKVFKTEIERPVELMELMSGNGIVPEDVGETETEWELLEGGKLAQAEDDVPEGKESVIRRYEFYEYTGLYDNEHEPLSTWDGNGDPPVDELGQFQSANMVAANLVAPPRTHGDYNNDGKVDASDYTVWRDRHGAEDYHGDGGDNGLVDDDDYFVWQHGFGQILDDGGNNPGGPGQGGAGAVVPEPMSGGLMLIATTLFILGRPSRKSRPTTI